MNVQKPFSVRRTSPEDAAAVLDCLQAAFEPYRELYTPAAFEDRALTPGTVGERLSTMAVFVAAAASGEVIGTVGARGNVAGSAARVAGAKVSASGASEARRKRDRFRRRPPHPGSPFPTDGLGSKSRVEAWDDLLQVNGVDYPIGRSEVKRAEGSNNAPHHTLNSIRSPVSREHRDQRSHNQSQSYRDCMS
jgi:hypothetical protein